MHVGDCARDAEREKSELEKRGGGNQGTPSNGSSALHLSLCSNMDMATSHAMSRQDAPITPGVGRWRGAVWGPSAPAPENRFRPYRRP